MAQKKLQRFAEIKTFANVLEYPANMPGKWSQFFKNNYPIILELACGKGEYTIGLSRLYPKKNFIGVDIKGNRIWVGAKAALKSQLTNTAFLRTQIEKIHEYFEPGEVSEIWITFPDPHLRISKAKRRLTYPRFLRLYQKILEPGGKIHLKTDSPDLYYFTKKVIEWYGMNLIADIQDVHTWEKEFPELRIITYYESLDIAKSESIFYLCFSLPNVIADKDREFLLFLKEEASPDQSQLLQ